MSSMRISLFLVITTLLLLSCKERQITKNEIPEKMPNIIYILADDLGYGDIGCFNTEGKINTPHIDKLAAEGMKFTDAHSPSAVCSPTRYGILTGRYSWRSELKSGVLTGKSKALIPNDRATAASLLKSQGYRTAFIGKWHLGWDWAQKDSTDFGGEGWDAQDFDNLDFEGSVTNNPNDLGFDYAYGHSGSLDMAPYVYVENGRATAMVDTVTEDTGKYTWWRKGPTASDFVHDQVTPNFFERALDYIEEAATKDNPFFLYLALPSPHTPILPTEEWQGKSGINPYADFVMMLDSYVGQLHRKVKEQGLSEHTLIVFTSDNGCSPQADFDILAERGHHPSGIYRGHKADIFEGGHRVPFIATWPDKIVPGTISSETVCQTDLLATCASIAGVELQANEAEDSFSMLPLFLNPNASEYQREATVHHSINGSFALRKDNFKLILCPGSGGWSDPKPNTPALEKLPPYQLYDLEKDPGEKNNLYEEHPEKVKELKELMVSYIKMGRSTPGPAQENAALNLQGKPWSQMEAIVSE